ncbi:helix-turn-helix domain-containing protein [Lutibacter sp. B2]|nr:helix-turn-helix domain-containing protein [Lutibacter sp. B2]
MKKYEVLEQVYKSNLPSRAKQVMFYLINRANSEGTCFPSIKTTASDCGVSTRTIQRTMQVLLESGFIKKDSRFREKGSQTSNLYTLQYPSVVNNVDEKKVKSEAKKVELNEEEMETVSFEDCKKDEEITENIVDTSTDCTIKKSENLNTKLTCEGDTSFIPIECHSNFMKSHKVKNEFSLNLELVNHKCHGESDVLYPP